MTDFINYVAQHPTVNILLIIFLLVLFRIAKVRGYGK